MKIIKLYFRNLHFRIATRITEITAALAPASPCPRPSNSERNAVTVQHIRIREGKVVITWALHVDSV